MPNHKIPMIGKKFNRLTVIEEAGKLRAVKNNKKITSILYLCLCDCGKQKTARGSKLRSGQTMSCGCLYKETALSKIPNMIKISTKYGPVEGLAVKVWKKHYDDDGLTFEDFMRLTQQSCYYCGGQPYNHLKGKLATFDYNGLDRMNSDLGHTADNCVPCCIICNRGKSDQEYNSAVQWMNRLSDNFNINKIIEITEASEPTGKILKYARGVFRGIKQRKTNLLFEEFYNLSQLNCYYCNGERSNNHILFNYNGLDRVDSNQRYVHGNVVPCCKWCNVAKKNLTIQEFAAWIYRLKKHELFRNNS